MLSYLLLLLTQSAFDADGDGIVTWDEALASLTKKIAEMKSDRRDVWVSH